MTKFGGIETTGTFGGWSLVDSDAGRLPQDVASGLFVAFENRDEKITPIYYHAYQVVNGMNHALVCRRERTQGENIVKDYVTVVINIPAKVDGYKEAKLVKMEVADETILSDEAKAAFDAKVKPLTGTTHKPLLEVGKQTVKGVNYIIICQSQVEYLGTEPYLTRIVINQFGSEISVTEIKRIG